jgi:hypothetical protein
MAISGSSETGTVWVTCTGANGSNTVGTITGSFD